VAATSKDFIVLNPKFNLLETGIASFSGESDKSVTIEFSKFTINEAFIVLTPTQDVNAFVSDRTQTSFKINVSQDNYQGSVHYHIYRADL
tara:strand:+ start:440 stop:709 length:270 start_codon:yes stop_codon:yes gene_type:complete